MSEDFSSLNLDTEARILESGEISAPREVIEAMRLAPETPVWRIVRLRLFEGLPLARHEAIVPVDIGRRLSEVDLRRTSIYRELSETLKIDLWEDYQIIDAIIADPAAAELLGVAIGAPLLCITRLYLTDGQKPLVLFRSLYRSDRYYYTIKLTEPGEEEHPQSAAAAALPIELSARRVRSN
jgi:GntR family transcriptional regulator